MIDYLDASNILYEYLFELQKNDSTGHAIICLVDTITIAVDNGKTAVGLRLDLKKASDKICHMTLLEKLYAYGIKRKK